MPDEAGTVAASERPTFEQAFASDASVAESHPAPTQESTETPSAAPASVDAIAPPADPAQADGTPAKGPIPFDRHDAIVKGVYKERDALKTQFDQLQQQTAWTKDVNPNDARLGAELARRFQTDRAGYLRDVMAEALQNPELAPLVRSEAARVLGTRSQPSAQDDLAPDIPVMDERGQVVSQTYSADRVRQIVAKAVQEAITKEVAPMRDDFQTRQAREKAAEETRQSEAYAKKAHARLSRLPGYTKETAKAIAAEMNNIPGDDLYEVAEEAWFRVVGKWLSNADETRTKQLDELQRKAAASTVNPSGAAVASTRRPTSFNDPSLQW